MTIDLVIRGGTVVDPASGLHARRDVDIGVLRLEEGRFPFVDSVVTAVARRRRLMPIATSRRGQRVRVS